MYMYMNIYEYLYMYEDVLDVQYIHTYEYRFIYTVIIWRYDTIMYSSTLFL